MGGGANHPSVPTYQGTVLNASVAPTYGTYPYARGPHWAALYPDALPPGAADPRRTAAAMMRVAARWTPAHLKRPIPESGGRSPEHC